MSLTLSRPELIRTGNLIDGEWHPAASGSRYAVSDPAALDVIAEAADSGADDARAATDAAARALPAWRATTARERAAILRAWHAAIVWHTEDLARLMSREQGKPLTEARGEVAYGASYVQWFAEEATRAYGDLIPQQQRGKRMSAVKEPIGIVAAITPWNFPLAMIARKIAPALAAGCTVVAKPAEDTPLTALALAFLAMEAGVPPGVLNMISASRERGVEAAGDWLADARVRKITFTGSTPVGKFLARESAATLKKLSLELGGNAPFIVFDDADLDAAADGLMAAKFRNGGQTCVCPNRVYVQDGVYDAFAARVAARVSALRVAPATDSAAQIGPMINARAVDKIARHVDDAVTRGARADGRPAPRRARPAFLCADRARRRRARHAALRRGDVRTGSCVVPLLDRGRSDRRRERHAVRPRRILLHAERTKDRARVVAARGGRRRHQRRRARERSGAVRRRQGIGLRPRRTALRARRLSRDQISVRRRPRLKPLMIERACDRMKPLTERHRVHGGGRARDRARPFRP
ncbi:aldehyde dehydrogenase family protein [Burkholderia oklahomensis]|uniref:Aldehyde dehydrogenase family protein n=1 Tax=Burkholderia oklahomensis TaxID=342113 RepID=A0AAI8BF97_9BURK|nr:aldehyde dehydrogenase family protein [Burkholderia oklahomensis]